LRRSEGPIYHFSVFRIGGDGAEALTPSIKEHGTMYLAQGAVELGGEVRVKALLGGPVGIQVLAIALFDGTSERFGDGWDMIQRPWIIE